MLPSRSAKSQSVAPRCKSASRRTPPGNISPGTLFKTVWLRAVVNKGGLAFGFAGSRNVAHALSPLTPNRLFDSNRSLQIRERDLIVRSNGELASKYSRLSVSRTPGKETGHESEWERHIAPTRRKRRRAERKLGVWAGGHGGATRSWEPTLSTRHRTRLRTTNESPMRLFAFGVRFDRGGWNSARLLDHLV
jgi:hypothetical protein